MLIVIGMVNALSYLNAAADQALGLSNQSHQHPFYMLVVDIPRVIIDVAVILIVIFGLVWATGVTEE
jgi:hypothetical protein